jgi:hypothetical protein
VCGSRENPQLVQGYLEQTIDPDKVKSEPIPKKNPGPVFTAVADNLMETVMQPDVDVVIHFYSRADDRCVHSPHCTPISDPTKDWYRGSRRPPSHGNSSRATMGSQPRSHALTPPFWRFSFSHSGPERALRPRCFHVADASLWGCMWAAAGRTRSSS